MKKTVLLAVVLELLIVCNMLFAQKGIDRPIPSVKPNKYQKAQIHRKYGMFLHFGINTFHNEEWTDGTKLAFSYAPSEIDADQWVKTAKDAGMKYVILVTKHHEGFCLWDSKLTDYDVANSGNKTNVVEAVAKACQKYKIGLGLYYSLWDRHQNSDVKDATADKAYNDYMIEQLKEMLQITKPYTKIVEFWFDGSWVKENYRWPLNEIYQTIKSREPQCQIGVNWNIGLPEKEDQQWVKPVDQKENYPIFYYPSDFRLGDPYLPGIPDPKIFTHDGKKYYMPWESTVCLSTKWFYNTEDSTYKSLDELVNLYQVATAQNNILIINTPPGRDGKIRQKDIELLKELKQKIDLLK